MFDLVLATTETEKALLQGYRPGLPVEIYPNVVDTEFFRPSGPPNPASLLFVGNFRHAPNVEGVRWFMAKVYPRIRQEAPEADLTVVGPSPPPDIRRLGRQKGIEVTGFVEDIRPYLEQSAVFVCPMISGGGMRGKVLEAMSMARPVVSTSRGVEGIRAVNGRDLFTAEAPGEFSDAVLRLLADPERGNTVGENARGLVEESYSTEVIFPRLEGRYERLIRARGAPSPS
jgi:glycosyltransferase involved in cell wall biosynthesis